MEDEIGRTARRWMRTYGSQTEWHLRQKIRRLDDWGDDEGAAVYSKVLQECQGRTAGKAANVWLQLQIGWLKHTSPLCQRISARMTKVKGPVSAANDLEIAADDAAPLLGRG